eukprot:scaffold4049_cov204-Alexandrium_tamarense.AAC.59
MPAVRISLDNVVWRCFVGGWMDLPFLKFSRCDTFRLCTFPRKWWGVLQLVDELSSCHDAVSGSHIEQMQQPTTEDCSKCCFIEVMKEEESQNKDGVSSPGVVQ